MSTPQSADTPYCTNADCLVRCDWRTLSQLLTEPATNTGPSTPVVPLTKDEVLASSTLTALLLEASGRIEASCAVAGRYSVDDLQTLTGGSAEMLKGLCARLAVWLCYNRRPDLGLKMSDEVKRAVEELASLEDGKLIFGLVENISAGKMSDIIETEAQIQLRGGLVLISERFFGVQANRRKPGVGP